MQSLAERQLDHTFAIELVQLVQNTTDDREATDETMLREAVVVFPAN